MTSTAAPSLPPDLAAQLANLRDIRLPEAISWWPPAPGWWALLAVFVISTAWLLGFERRRRRSLKYRALRELERLQAEKAARGSTLELAAELCVLLRRIVLNGLHGRQFASVHSDAWGEYLASAPHGMPQPIARFIANAPYVREDTSNGERERNAPQKQALIVAAENWIRRHA